MKKHMWSAGIAVMVTVMAAQFAGTFAHSAKAQEPNVAKVKVDNFSFSPATVTVPVGAMVIWTNHDDIPHNVVSTDKVFKSKVMDTDDKFSYTFTKPGTYQYFCGIHPHMTGTVVVR